MGVFDDASEEEPSTEGPRSAVWGSYLAWHARRQLAFGGFAPFANMDGFSVLTLQIDMWWIALALFLLCIIERSKIQDEDNFQWFTIFTLSELFLISGAISCTDPLV